MTLDIGRAVSMPPPISLSTMSTYSFFGSRGRPADHLHDLVAAVLQPFQQFGRRMGRRLLEVVHQDDAFAVLFELLHHRLTTWSGLRILKSNESMSVEKTPTLRSPTYFSSSGGCRSAGKRKNGAVGLLPSAMLTAAMPFSISSIPSCWLSLDRSLCDQVCDPIVCPAGRHLLQDFGMPPGMFSDREKERLGALIGERLQHGRRVPRPWAVIEREHDFLVAQEVVGLEVLEPETRAARGVDFNHARDAERIRIVASRFCRRGCRRRRRWGRCRGGRILGQGR